MLVRCSLAALGCLLSVSCQPPAERAQAAVGLTPMVLSVPVITPTVAVLPAPPPKAVPVPELEPVLMLAAIEGESEEADGHELPAAMDHENTPGSDTDFAFQADVPTAATGVGAQAPVDGTDPAAQPVPSTVEPFEMLGEKVAAGTFARLTWTPTETFTGNTVPSAVLVTHGVQAGPTLCLTAAVHGD
jgi:hypothetical protein